MTIKAHFTDKPPAGIREIEICPTPPLPGTYTKAPNEIQDYHDYVAVERDNIPVLTLRLASPVDWGPFREVEVFGGYVAIGIQDRFHLFDMVDESYMALKLDGYFGHLYVDGGELFVCSASELICIDSGGAIRWIADEIAVDGVIINSFDGDILRVSSEMDPPGGWVDVLVSRVNGKVIEQVIS